MDAEFYTQVERSGIPSENHLSSGDGVVVGGVVCVKNADRSLRLAQGRSCSALPVAAVMGLSKGSCQWEMEIVRLVRRVHRRQELAPNADTNTAVLPKGAMPGRHVSVRL